VLPTNHIRSLDALRGLAALSVVLFHYGVAILPSITPNPLTEFLRPGRLGLHVFFVISGFVIPYAMHRSGYTWSTFGTFLARRWVRLGPPAYAAACLMILYYVLAMWSKGSPVNTAEFPGFGAEAIWTNLTFTVGLTEQPGDEPGGYWYNFVYWSLAIEFQFYILLGLLFPLLMNAQRKWLSPVVMIALLFISAFPSVMFFHYTVYFLLGLLAFQRHALFIGTPQFTVSCLVCSAVGIADGHTAETIVSLGAAAVILATPAGIPRPFLWLGTISYSLYILHPPVGYFMDSIGKRVTDIHNDPYGKVVLLFLYTAITICLSWVFYRLVEKPFLKWSKRIGKGNSQRTSSTLSTEVVP